MTRIDHAALEALTPNAQPVYRQAFEHADQLFAFDIDTRLRLEHFLAQSLHESGGLRLLIENLNYSAKRLTQVWPKRFKTLQAAQHFAHNPRALANNVYANRMGIVDPNDGWRFIGRGLLQITGRFNYARAGAALGLPLTDNPTLALAPEHALQVAGFVWFSARCNEPADRDDIEQVTKRINGGTIGLDDRREWLRKVRERNVVIEDGE